MESTGLQKPEMGYAKKQVPRGMLVASSLGMTGLYDYDREAERDL
jgi:hypothetical protein